MTLTTQAYRLTKKEDSNMDIKYTIYLLDKDGNKVNAYTGINQEQRDKWIALLDKGQDPNNFTDYQIHPYIEK